MDLVPTDCFGTCSASLSAHTYKRCVSLDDVAVSVLEQCHCAMNVEGVVLSLLVATQRVKCVEGAANKGGRLTQ